MDVIERIEERMKLLTKFLTHTEVRIEHAQAKADKPQEAALEKERIGLDARIQELELLKHYLNKNR